MRDTICYYGLNKIERRKESKETRASFCHMQRVLCGHKSIPLSPSGRRWIQPSKPGPEKPPSRSLLTLLPISQQNAEEGNGQGLQGLADDRATDGKSLGPLAAAYPKHSHSTLPEWKINFWYEIGGFVLQ